MLYYISKNDVLYFQRQIQIERSTFKYIWSYKLWSQSQNLPNSNNLGMFAILDVFRNIYVIGLYIDRSNLQILECCSYLRTQGYIVTAFSMTLTQFNITTIIYVVNYTLKNLIYQICYQK